MNTEQPLALKLADELDRFGTVIDHKDAAAELRRLHAEVDRLNYRLAYPDNFVNPEVQELRAENDRLRKALKLLGVDDITGEKA